MKKLVIGLALAGLILLPLSLSAQTEAAGSGFQIMSIDIGYAPSWDLNLTDNATPDQEAFIAPALFGLNIRVADNFIVGVETLTGSNGVAGTDTYLNVKYNFLPRVRGVVGFGQTRLFAADVTKPEPAAALGFEVIPFTRVAAGSVTTEFKVAFRYLATVTDLKNSGLVFALAFGIGF
ncbi:MAG: hypothetical protein LBQ88_21790 [Treponema sp.]|jgi:hypothetical protein|nr:hypothetical protein [Treponema sp.]